MGILISRNSLRCANGSSRLLLALLLSTVSISSSLQDLALQERGHSGFQVPLVFQPSASSPITSYPIPTPNSNPQAIVLGADNHTLWFTEIGAGKIGEFSTITNNVTREIPVPASGASPYTLAIDNRGLIWFTDDNQQSPSVWFLNVTGSAPVFHQILTNTSPSDPIFVLVDHVTDYVWFTDYSGNYMGEITGPNSAVAKYPLPTANSGPVEIAKQNGTSYLWISEASGRIVRFDTATNKFQEFLPTVSLSYPVGIVVDKSGSVWVSEHYGSSVTEFTPTNSTWRKYPTSQSSIGPGSGVATLTIDSQGRLWFAEHFSSRIGRLDPSTGEMVEFPLQTAGSYSLLNAVDNQGNFWFTEAGSANSIGMIPGNTNSSVSITPISAPSGAVTSGSSSTARFNVTNLDQMRGVTLVLNVTSSYSTNYYTTKSQVGLSNYSLTLGPGKSATVSMVTTPDFGLSSGLYSAGLVVSNNGILTTSIIVLEVQENLLHRIGTLLPIILIVAAALLASILIFSRYRKRNVLRPKITAGSAVPAALAFALVSLVSIQEASLAWGKCPLPPPPGNNGIDIYGVALDVGAVAFFAVVAYFFIRSWLRGRGPPKNGEETVEEKAPS